AIGPIAWAGDVELDGRGGVVVGGPPGDDLLHFSPVADVAAEDPPLRARNYDGRGIVRTPDGRIGFWTSGGFRIAVTARLTYEASGRVDLFQLDGGDYRRQWGRIFLDACIPTGTSVQVVCVTSDDEPGDLEPDGPSIPRIL